MATEEEEEEDLLTCKEDGFELDKNCTLCPCQTYGLKFWQSTSWMYCKAVVTKNVHLT